MAERIIKCVICGRLFTTSHSRQRTCSEECKKELHRRNVESYQQKQLEESKARVTSYESQQELIDIAVLAKQAGMSYGQYVAKYGL